MRTSDIVCGICLLGLLVAANGLSYTIPCDVNGLPKGCDQTRWKPCNFYSGQGHEVIHFNDSSHCGEGVPFDQMSSFQVGVWFVVQFTGGNGRCLEILMQAGECWGPHPSNHGQYNCQGRCGPSCGTPLSVCSNWSRDCLKHDVCSWFYGASGGYEDPNCGDEFKQAENDWFVDCLIDGRCKVANPACLN
eukprot:TRINITY_DN6584_c0_g2_i1.p1 TRINITY_DN6584_c0_g2~~TRINITY_DN6584_c0_g2_i1.p1  ORF type:complete len:190 (+),score=26.80 TRINITY_DN6584_c0_g2_i1:111-680(+)